MTDSVLPVEILEERAVQQRRRIHNSVEELRYSLRDRLDLNANIRQHWGIAAGTATLLGLVLGYTFGALFPPLVVANPAIKAIQAPLVRGPDGLGYLQICVHSHRSTPAFSSLRGINHCHSFIQGNAMAHSRRRLARVQDR